MTMFCPNCGKPIAEDDRFCRSCGKALTSGSAPEATVEPDAESPSSPSLGYDEQSSFDSIPVIGKKRVNAWEVERDRLRAEPDDEWTMSSLGPPPPRKNRKWLWVVIGVIAAIVLACCLFSFWMTMTDSGKHWADNIMTQAAEQQATSEPTYTPFASPLASPTP